MNMNPIKIKAVDDLLRRHHPLHPTTKDCNHQCLRAIRVGPVDDVEGVALAEEVLLVQRLGRQVWRGNWRLIK